MSVSVLEHISHADDWVACLWSLLAELMEGLLDCWNILIGYILSLSGIDKHISHICILISDVLVDWLNISNDLGVLSGTTCLLFVKIVELGLGPDGLSVVNGWISNVDVDIILSLDSLAVDEEMKLTHARDNNFLTFLIVIDSESWILPLESIQGLKEGVEIGHLLGLDGERHNGVWNVHLCHLEVYVLIAESFSRRAINSEKSEDVSGSSLIDIDHVC
jgi:hypothetical protein